MTTNRTMPPAMLPDDLAEAMQAHQCRECGGFGRVPNHGRVGALLRKRRQASSGKGNIRVRGDVTLAAIGKAMGGISAPAVLAFERGRRVWTWARVRAYLGALSKATKRKGQ